jgi:outer membrane protein assembly factor BamB
MGRTVAHHVLHARVLRDAVSDVWYARHAQRPTQQAIVRVISADAPRASLTACLAEARAASGVLHPHVIRVRAVGDEESPYVLCRMARVVPLAARLTTPWTVADVVDMLGPVGDALDAAAAAGVPHGAVHPRTLWIEDRRAVGGPLRGVIAGFGLHHLLGDVAARDRHRAPPDDLLYVAPELLRGAAPSNRSDQYALAAAVLHALRARPPFARRTVAGLFGAHLFAHPPTVGDDTVDADGDAAAELDRLLARALAKDPDERFEQCNIFMVALSAWNGAYGDGTDVLGERRDAADANAPITVTQPGRRRVTARTAAVAAASAAAIVGGAFGVVWLARGPAPPTDATVVSADADVAPQPSRAPAAVETPATAAATERSVRWRGQIDARPSALHMTAAGLLVETDDQTVVVDPATGEVRGTLPVDGHGVVAANGQFVAGGSDSLQAVDVAARSVRWQIPVTTSSPPTAVDDIVYGISDADVPQLIATDAASGERLWAFPEGEAAFPAGAAVAARADFVYLADDGAVYGILPIGAMAGTDTPLITATEPAKEPLCLWRHEVDERMWTGSLVAADGGVVIANRSGTVCLRGHADGVPVWCVPVQGVGRAQPTIYDVGDQIVVVTRAAVTALDTRAGTVLWQQLGPWRRTVRDGDRLVAVEGDGGLATVSLATGTVRRPITTGIGPRALLAVDGDVVFAARRDGSLISVEIPGGLQRQ